MGKKVKKRDELLSKMEERLIKLLDIQAKRWLDRKPVSDEDRRLADDVARLKNQIAGRRRTLIKEGKRDEL